MKSIAYPDDVALVVSAKTPEKVVRRGSRTGLGLVRRSGVIWRLPRSRQKIFLVTDKRKRN